MQASLLKHLFLQQYADNYKPLAIEQLTERYLQEASLDGRIIEKAILCDDLALKDTPWKILDMWRDTLAIILILKAKDLLQPCRQLLIDRIKKLSHTGLWKEFQLAALYQAIARCLLDKPVKEVYLSQQSNGACPLEGGSHWSWAEIPHPSLHSEFGILLCVYASLTGLQAYSSAAEQLAEWQCNTLDRDFSPFIGFFSQESDAVAETLLINNYLLFDAIARFSGRPDMAYIADKQLAHLSSLTAANPVSVHYWPVVLEAWLSSYTRLPASSDFRLPEIIEDRHLAFAGCRNEKVSVVSTIFGGGSGMGCFHAQDLQVVNFGPQHLPLGDCRGFGIEGAGRLLGGHVKKVESGTGSYEVEGVARLASRPSSVKMASGAAYRTGDHGGFWLDVRQRFSNDCLSVETAFNGLFEISNLAFVFFIKAPICLVGGKKVVKLRSFERYQGEVRHLQFQSKKNSVTIEAMHKSREMHVIPLGGGANFWGADFLAAYSLDDRQRNYSWQMRSN